MHALDVFAVILNRRNTGQRTDTAVVQEYVVRITDVPIGRFIAHFSKHAVIFDFLSGIIISFDIGLADRGHPTPIVIKFNVRTNFPEDRVFLRTAYIDVFHVADGCADVDILIHRQHALNRGKMSAAAADAPCVVVQTACTAARINFGRQGFIVKEDFAAGDFSIPHAAV